MAVHQAVLVPSRSLDVPTPAHWQAHSHPLAQLYEYLSPGTQQQSPRVANARSIAHKLERQELRRLYQQVVTAYPHRGSLDCLIHTLVTPPSKLVSTRRCIVSIVSPGYEHLLDTMLASLQRFGECADVAKVVLCVDGDASCRKVIARHNATIVECTSLSKVGASMRGALYSIARWIDAEEFLLLDADMLIVGSLRPLFDSLQVLDPYSIGMVRARRGWWDSELDDPADLSEVMQQDFSGDADDIAFLTGEATLPHFYWYNGGLMLAKREALLALDARLRHLEPFGSLWIDERPDLYWREEGLMNIALATHNEAPELPIVRGVLLDDAWNLLMFRQSVEIKWEGHKLHLLHQGRPARVLHLVGKGKPLYAELCRLLDLPTKKT